MTQRDKLFDEIVRNPKGVRLSDAIKAAEMLGFVRPGGKGSHKAFSRSGEPVGLNFQDDGNGKIPPYQGKQLAAMIEKYRGEA